MLSMGDSYRRTSSVVSVEIGGGQMLVPIRQKAGDLDFVYTLNETASLIWELAGEERTVGEIRARIVEEFEVDDEQAEQDLLQFLGELEALGALEKA